MSSFSIDSSVRETRHDASDDRRKADRSVRENACRCVAAARQTMNAMKGWRGAATEGDMPSQ